MTGAALKLPDTAVDSRCFEDDTANMVSISGGKDSLAMWLLALENEVPNLQPVFADTGHEHAATYEYIDYLERKLGPIKRVKADFTKQIERKRKYIAEQWPKKLMTETAGRWRKVSAKLLFDSGKPAPLEDERRFSVGIRHRGWLWLSAIPAMTEAEAGNVIDRALRTLQPTGNPFLDLCLWKGRFPSTKARFCTFELKHEPVRLQVAEPLLDTYDEVISWQGVRAQESPARAGLPMWVDDADDTRGLNVYRPIINWLHDDVFALAKRHGIKPNPLYQQGMSRVGCMPCVNCRKSELKELYNRFPDELARVAEWEQLVAACSKRGSSTFFRAGSTDPVSGEQDNRRITLERHGIIALASGWAQTSRGGRQFDLFTETEDIGTCSSVYTGVCE